MFDKFRAKIHGLAYCIPERLRHFNNFFSERKMFTLFDNIQHILPLLFTP